MGDNNRRPRPGGFRGRGPRQNRGARRNHQAADHREGQNPVPVPNAVQQAEVRNNPEDELMFRGPTRNFETRTPRPMGFRRMQELEERDPTEVMFTLLDVKEGFKELIASQTLNMERIVLILSLLARACNSDQKENLRALIKSVHSVQQFSYVSLQSYLCELQNGTFLSQMEVSLANMLLFLETTQEMEPKTPTTGILLPLLKETLHILDTRVGQELRTRFTVLQEKRDKFRGKYNVPFLSQAQSDPPPNNFRNIPLFPDSEDLKDKRPFLRPNIVDGRYADTEHYLDVQYRLLREDFVRPLREGIAAYVRQIESKEKKKIQDVRVYTNVHLHQALMTEDGIIHEVNFDVTPYRRIRWETNRRLIFGSLLCFSHDNFETMMFGTVAVRKPEDLAKGKFYVKIEDHHNLPALQTVTFVILETQAYFEAYRHNLLALQFLEVLPFKEFIVELSREVGPPSHLKEHAKYCLNPVLKTHDESKDVDVLLGTDAHTDHRPTCFCGLFGSCNHIEVMNDTSWPTAIDMGLDPSQYDAFKLSLTNQLAIIQGPPGTGKTHVGLKIIQALLHNRESWQADGKVGQILVICYTNHALDQFLEGVLKFTDLVVRIGGRCQSEVLYKYNIRTLRRTVAFERKRARYIHNNDLDIKHELVAIVQDIDKLQQNVKNCYKSILMEDSLEEVIGEDLLLSFNLDCPKYVINCEPKMPYWLGLAVPGVLEMLQESDDEVEANLVETVELPNAIEVDDNEDFENADDIEYENDLRTEGDEFINGRVIARKNFGEFRFENAITDGWQLQRGMKRQLKSLRNFRKYSVMADEEIEQVRNVWALSMDNRRRLYKAWIEKLQVQAKNKLEELNMEYQNKLKMAIELSCEEDFLVAKKKHVIGMTTTGAAKFRSLVRRLKPQIIIVEEAAEVLEAHIVTALTESTQHLILIGDHQQLRPNPTVYELAKRYKLDVSLFERLINNGLPFCRLGLQHRMKPCISKLLVPHIYAFLEDHESVKEYEEIKGTDKSMYFINHKVKELAEQDSTSRINLHEAEFLARLCRHLLLQGYRQQQITILATYTGQFLCLKQLMADSMYQGVRITVVDNYQGEENDIILLSLVRSNDEGNVGFLKVENRVCVALSRAKKGLYCIGNFDLLRKESKLWENIYRELLLLEAVGPSLNVRCQNHGNIVAINVPNDFDNVINGGCSDPCDFRLDCGHSCGLLCHPYDGDHIEYKCIKPCTKILCSLDHKCPQICHLPCGDCQVLVVKVLPKCNHEAQVVCHLDVSKVNCMVPCPKILECGHNCLLRCGQRCGPCKVLVTVKGPCGHNVRLECALSSNEDAIVSSCIQRCEKQLPCSHPCPKLCGDSCALACKVMVEHQSPCGHPVRISCHETSSEEKVLAACTHPCRKSLECDHICAGNCSLCHQGRIHHPCQMQCGKPLVCGHICKLPCPKTCPPCSRRCENRCTHSRCQHPCGAPCDPCNEPCAWKCIHAKCTKLCGEPCNRPPCTRPCQKLLKCRHECIGLCGEPCPRKCLVCDRKEVTEIFFGDEDEPSSRFIELEDCGHIFESKGLTQWIESQQSGEIQLPSCPRCKTPIRRNLHFSTYVKNCMVKVEMVKRKNFGQLEKINDKQVQLQSILTTEHLHLWEICRKSQGLRERHLRMEQVNPCSEIVTQIIDQLSRKGRRVISMEMLIQMENFLGFVRLLNAIQRVLSEPKNIISKTFSEHVVSSVGDITNAMKTNFTVVSTQFLEDINWEIQRTTILADFMKQLEKKCEVSTNLEVKQLFTSATEILMKRSSFRNENKTSIEEMIKKMAELLGSACIGISKEDKFQILKAMNLQQGHWFQCPNGHVYCITECGGARVESVCNECKAPIGGSSYRLRGDNRIATEMDGSRFGAWSEQNNILNYDQADINRPF